MRNETSFGALVLAVTLGFIVGMAFSVWQIDGDQMVACHVTEEGRL